MAARDKGEAQYMQFTSTIDFETRHPLTLGSSSRETDESYKNDLKAFDWDAFFGVRGDFIEKSRGQSKTDFDITLIDSRTGLSDTGGICTIELPNIVVGMFTTN